MKKGEIRMCHAQDKDILRKIADEFNAMKDEKQVSDLDFMYTTAGKNGENLACKASVFSNQGVGSLPAGESA